MKKQTLYPPRLQVGSLVGIIAPARAVEANAVATGIAWLQAKGFNFCLGNTIGSRHHRYAASLPERLADLQSMLNRTDIEAIWCAAGGYGSMQLLDALDLHHFSQHPKWLIGYSDVSALLAHVYHTTKVATIHATMPVSLPKQAASLPSLYRLLTCKSLASLPAYAWQSANSNISGTAKGKLIGGNLSVWMHLMGSAAFPSSLEGYILFIEDVSEWHYRIDRMFWQLKRSGLLSNLAGMLVGSFSDLPIDSPPFGSSVYQIITDLVAEYSFPVAFGFPAGHDIANEAIVIGATVNLEVQNNTAVMAYIA